MHILGVQTIVLYNLFCIHLVYHRRAKRTVLSHAIFIIFRLFGVGIPSERSLLDVRSMVCCALESVSVAPLLASWSPGGLRPRCAARLAQLRIARWLCHAQAARFWFIGLWWSRRGPRCPTRRLWHTPCTMSLHDCSTAASATSFASPYAELHVRQRLCTARATRLARGERLQSSKRQAWRRLYADLCGRLSVYAIDPSSECII